MVGWLVRWLHDWLGGWGVVGFVVVMVGWLAGMV